MTGEHWAPTPPEPPARPDPFAIANLDDVSRASEIDRDLALMTRRLEQDPTNVPYLFFLGRTLVGLGRIAEGIEWLRKRKVAGGADEEAWYAEYCEGLALLRTDEHERGVAVLLSAHARRPHRNEPLLALARHLRSRLQYAQAFDLAERACRRTAACDDHGALDRLFLEPADYDTAPLQEAMAAAFHLVDRWEDGRDAGEEILRTQGYSDLVYEHALQVLCCYLRKAMAAPPGELPRCDLVRLARASGRFPVSEALRTSSVRHWGLREPNRTEYAPKNPSCVVFGGRLLVNVPIVNYRHERGRVFASKDPDGIVRTRNVILDWDLARRIPRGESESHIELPSGWPREPRVRGLEDQRWCLHEGRIWFTATTYHAPRASPRGPQVVLGRQGTTMAGPDLLLALHWEGAKACEKNWLPFSCDGRLFLLYGYDPMTVLEVDPDTGRCATHHQSVPDVNTRDWRGGAVLPLPDGSFLLLVHQTARFWEADLRAIEADRTVYLHRLVRLDSRYQVRAHSDLFVFDHVGVEYACGLAMTGPSTVIITYGSEEREARWAELDLATLNAQLRREVASDTRADLAPRQAAG